MVLPANWRVAESIRQLHRQLRPLAPNAPAVAFGTVGDAAHGTSGEHYPRVYPGLGTRPVVCAGDFPKAGNLNPWTVLDSIRRSRDPRVAYGISEGRMFSSYPTSRYPAWTWRPYSGADRHDTHGHLSVVGDARADGTQAWQISTRTESATSIERPTVEDDMAGELADALLSEWAWGNPNFNSGGAARPIAPVHWRMRDEAWQAKVTEELAAAKNARTAADAADATRDAATTAAVKALGDALNTALAGGTGTVIDTATIVAAIRQEAASTRTAVADRDDELAALKAELAAVRAAAEANLSPTELNLLYP